MMLCMHALLFPHSGRGRRQRYPIQGNAQARDSDEPWRHHHAAAPSTHPGGGGAAGAATATRLPEGFALPWQIGWFWPRNILYLKAGAQGAVQ